MMRRFSRRRRGGSTPTAAPIDAAHWLARLAAEPTIPTEALTVLEADELPASLAVLGTGEASDGSPLLVAFAPNRATDALLAGLAVAGRLAAAEGGWNGELLVVADEWPVAARRVLGLVGEVSYRFRALTVPALADGTPRVEPEAAVALGALSPLQIAGHLPGPADRDLFLRAARGLEGLAAKHGGAVRGNGRAVEFVLLASRVAELRAEDGGVVLATLAPQRSKATLSADGLAGTLDAFEGQLRKHLNDRRVREGDAGFRARAITEFRAWHSLRALVPWPLGGSDAEILDWVGVDVAGRPVVGAVRTALSLEGLGVILDAALRLQPSLPGVLANAPPPVVFDAPRLIVGGREVAAGVRQALDALSLSHELFEIRDGREGIELVAIAEGEAPSRSRASRPPRRPRARRDESTRSAASDAAEEGPTEGLEAEGETGDAEVSARTGDTDRAERGEGGGRSRGRRRRGGRRRGGSRDDARGDGERSEGTGDGPVDGEDRSESASSQGKPEDGDRSASRFDEVSVFDLDDEPSSRSDGGARRRGRSRRRGRRGGTGAEGESGGSSPEKVVSESDHPGDRKRRGSRPDAAASADADPESDDAFDDEDSELDLDLEDVPDFEQAAVPEYEDDDDEESGGEAKPAPKARAPAPGLAADLDVPRLPKGRGAIIAHADLDSLFSALLLARDIRQLEGLWLYPQDELMNSFRNVTTDLRDDTAIFIVGFTPSPARDVLQAASLYRDRMVWFDHHEWPPEDLQGLRDAIGENWVNVSPGAGSSLSAVIDACSRRSRFTDKLVDLACGRFTHHDYERWGRLWSWRLAEFVKRTGDCRADIEPLLSGRPSDLAREAARAETPPVPPEVGYVSSRDFRLVHFAGYALVVVPVPAEFDLHLSARIARERYEAPLSLAYRPNEDLVVFAGDELSGKRSLDMSGLAEHVAQKLEWVDQLADGDHVARFRVRELSSHPERLDEIVSEIAMGRSILER